MKTRYSFGGDEHVFVEVDEEMSLEAFFKSLSMTKAVRDSRHQGRDGNLPGQRFAPDQLRSGRRSAPTTCWPSCKQIEAAAETSEPNAQDADHRNPGLYNDPWTHETLMRFRERHQDAGDAPTSNTRPRSTAMTASRASSRRIPARRGSSRWSASSPACRSCTRWSSARSRSRCPKYLRPRTDTPKLTVGHGGCFGCIYSVRGAGGYQMFGITPMPIYDPKQESPISATS